VKEGKLVDYDGALKIYPILDIAVEETTGVEQVHHVYGTFSTDDILATDIATVDR
jgi:hypothetical protein